MPELEVPNKESKSSGDGSSEYIKLKVIGQDTNEIHFRVKMTTLLGKMKKVYGERLGLPEDSFELSFNKCLIEDNDTPQELEMEYDDVVEVLMLGKPNDADADDQSSSTEDVSALPYANV